MSRKGVEATWQQLRAKQTGLHAELLDFTCQVYGYDILRQAWSEFTSAEEAVPAFSVRTPHLNLFVSWLLHSWAPAHRPGTIARDYFYYGVPPTAAYLDRCCRTIRPDLRRYLQKCLQTPLGFYEVIGGGPGPEPIVRDLGNKTALRVLDSSTAPKLKPKQIVFGQYVPMEQGGRFEACVPLSIPSEYRTKIVERYTVLPEVGKIMAFQAVRERNFKLLELYFDLHPRKVRPTQTSTTTERRYPTAPSPLPGEP